MLTESVKYIAMVVGVVVLLGFLYILWIRFISYAFKKKDQLAYSKWDEVPAKLVTSAFPKLGTRGPETARIYSYVAEFQYTYTYKGQEYEGKDIVDQVPLEDVGLIVWVNPDNPKESKVCRYNVYKGWRNLENIG